jgi:adenylate cyclase class IV
MPLETEARFSIAENRFDQVMSTLQRELSLGQFSLKSNGTRVHADTYFDTDKWLLAKGWSLRIRQRDDDIRLTLKRPITGDTDHGVVHDEIENPRSGSFVEVVEQIIAILKDAGAVKTEVASATLKLMREGAFAALRSCGLNDLFTVETTRHAWLVAFDDTEIAELVLDDSCYHIRGAEDPEPIRECRMEVELFEASRQHLLGEISQCVRSRFDVDEVRDSKFDRGMVYYSTRKLRDKMEAKITIEELGDYQSIINRIENTENFVRYYHFSRLAHRGISDIYFDTAGHDLFRAGCYLRLREEHKNRELTFRRLAEPVKYGQVLQQEIVAKGDGDAFGRNWDLITKWLERTANVQPDGMNSTLADIEVALQHLGLRRVLEVDIARLPWLVSRVDPQKGWRREEANHVAKVKYDQITFRRPGDRVNIVRAVEFEVAGVEDESSGLHETQLNAYETFLNQFAEACAHSSSDGKVVRRVNAKYFHGMLGLGIASETPEWLADGRLGLSMSLLRKTTRENPALLVQQRDQLLEQQRTTAENAIEVKDDVAAIREELRDTDSTLLPDQVSYIDSRLKKVEDWIERLTFININMVQGVTQNVDIEHNIYIDLTALSTELERILVGFEKAARPEDTDSITAVRAAKEAADRGDAPAARSQLQKLGKRALDMAQNVGAGVAAAIIAARLGG